MTRAEIQAFLAVVENGSISRAADELFLRQSTLSGAFRRWKRAEHDSLQRGKGVRSTELTDTGRDFVPIAEKWEQLWQETLSAASKRRNKALSVSAILT
jgi:DNA-binding transcriptional LysR family regulator